MRTDIYLINQVDSIYVSCPGRMTGHAFISVSITTDKSNVTMKLSPREARGLVKTMTQVLHNLDTEVTVRPTKLRSSFWFAVENDN